MKVIKKYMKPARANEWKDSLKNEYLMNKLKKLKFHVMFKHNVIMDNLLATRGLSFADLACASKK